MRPRFPAKNAITNACGSCTSTAICATSLPSRRPGAAGSIFLILNYETLSSNETIYHREPSRSDGSAHHAYGEYRADGQGNTAKPEAGGTRTGIPYGSRGLQAGQPCRSYHLLQSVQKRDSRKQAGKKAVFRKIGAFGMDQIRKGEDGCRDPPGGGQQTRQKERILKKPAGSLQAFRFVPYMYLVWFKSLRMLPCDFRALVFVT